MSPTRRAEEAFTLAAWLRTASHDAFGDKVVPPSIALRIERLLDDVARPVDARKREREAA